MKMKNRQNDYTGFTQIITERSEWRSKDFRDLCLANGWNHERLEKTLNDELGMSGQEVIETCRKKRALLTLESNFIRFAKRHIIKTQ